MSESRDQPVCCNPSQTPVEARRDLMHQIHSHMLITEKLNEMRQRVANYPEATKVINEWILEAGRVNEELESQIANSFAAETPVTDPVWHDMEKDIPECGAECVVRNAENFPFRARWTGTGWLPRQEDEEAFPDWAHISSWRLLDAEETKAYRDSLSCGPTPVTEEPKPEVSPP